MDDSLEEQPTNRTSLLYTIEDSPNWVLSTILGIQHYLTTIGGLIGVPFILAPALCIVESDPARGYLISTIFLVSGISTILQCTVGVRLPLIQWTSFAFVSCIKSYLNSSGWSCPGPGELFAMGKENRELEWHDRMFEIQGAIIMVGAIESLLGFSGIIGLMVRFISPLTIAPTVTLIGLSMVEEAAEVAKGNWYIASSTILLVVIFSQFLRNVHTPVLYYSGTKGFQVFWIRGFQLFSVLLTTVVIWIICYVLTTTDTLDIDDEGRIDLKLEIIEDAAWFRIPYPFQWGWPRFTARAIFAMLAALFAGLCESLGDYYACASMCDKSPPPTYAISRGVGVEGIGNMLAGIFGVGPGITSFSENIGAIGVTKIASRRVIICGAIVTIFVSFFGKIGALFALIPTPIVGGLLCVMFSMVSAVGLSHLKHVDLTSHRNMFVLGSSMFFGLGIPNWVKNTEMVTGNETADQVILVLCSNKIFIAAITAFILDNILPGTAEERGMVRSQQYSTTRSNLDKTYKLPSFLKFFEESECCIASFMNCGKCI